MSDNRCTNCQRPLMTPAERARVEGNLLDGLGPQPADPARCDGACKPLLSEWGRLFGELFRSYPRGVVNRIAVSIERFRPGLGCAWSVESPDGQRVTGNEWGGDREEAEAAAKRGEPWEPEELEKKMQSAKNSAKSVLQQARAIFAELQRRDQGAMHDQVGVAADRRGEMRIAAQVEAEVPDVLWRILGLALRAQHDLVDEMHARRLASADALGGEPDRDAVSPMDLAKTVYRLLGINGDKRIMADGGRPIDIVNGGRIMSELFA